MRLLIHRISSSSVNEEIFSDNSNIQKHPLLCIFEKTRRRTRKFKR